MRQDWQDFRRGLRREDKEDFDRLFDRAEEHADAAGYQNPTDPFRGLLLSIILEQEKELQELRERVKD